MTVLWIQAIARTTFSSEINSIDVKLHDYAFKNKTVAGHGGFNPSTFPSTLIPAL